MSQYLDNEGLLYFWQKVKNAFAAKAHSHTISETETLQTELDKSKPSTDAGNALTQKANGLYVPTPTPPDLSSYAKSADLTTHTGDAVSHVTQAEKDAWNAGGDISGKMDKANPTGTGSLSVNRKANTPIGTNSVALGQDCTASTTGTFAFGFNATAIGSGSIAMGTNTTTNGNVSLAIGKDAQTSGMYSTAIGCYATTNADYQTVIGKYNSLDASKAFVIGGGSYEARKNIFTVEQDTGNVTCGNVNGIDLVALSSHPGDTTKHVTAAERTAWNNKANTASPTFTGVPKAPTPSAGTNDDQIATTAFVKAEVNSSAMKTKTVVTELPATGEDNKIYLKKVTGTTGNVHEEYLWIEGKWELIGDTEVVIEAISNAQIDAIVAS